MSCPINLIKYSLDYHGYQTFAICSNHRPKDTNINNMGGVSKKVFICSPVTKAAINTITTYKVGVVILYKGVCLVLTE